MKEIESMRAIKFRAWDREAEIMYSVRDINFCGEEIDTNEMQGDWIGFEQVELLQFTGLHDKNGKEIYEGDIVRCFIDEWEEVSEVFWEDATFSIHAKNTDPDYKPCLYEANNIKVIGNIYENPELLSKGGGAK